MYQARAIPMTKKITVPGFPNQLPNQTTTTWSRQLPGARGGRTTWADACGNGIASTGADELAGADGATDARGTAVTGLTVSGTAGTGADAGGTAASGITGSRVVATGSASD